MNAHDDYLAEALARLQDAIRERVGSTVLLSKADACAIGAALAAPKEAGTVSRYKAHVAMEREARAYREGQADAASDQHCDVCGFTKSGLSECPNASAHVASDAVPQADQQGVTEYATKLARFVWRENYALEAPEWEPCPDLMGVLTQIDNMLPGLMRKPKPSDQQGASLEGDAAHGEEVAKILARHGYHAAAATVRRLASKASPDDQRQEGECRCHEGNGARDCAIHTQADFDAQQDASPPTEAAAAVGEDPVVGHKTHIDDAGRFYRTPLRQSEANELLAHIERARQERERLMPDERTAIDLMWSAWYRLKDFGWREACYCPKDGSEFDVIEAGSTGIHRTSYYGTWPTGGCIDISTPVLFRAALSPTASAAREGSK